MENIDFSSLLKAVGALANRNDNLREQHLWNALSLIHQEFGQGSWVGLYIDNGEKLLLGPFQGTPACEQIAYGRGVVGASYEKQEALYVNDVSNFPGYICCDASAKSEVCVPLENKESKIKAILDIDYPDFHHFEDEQKEAYIQLADLLSNLLG